MGKIKIVDVISKHFREQGYYANAGWHGTYSMDGGGPFIQQGSHMIDIALWLCGGYEEVVDARRFQLYHDIETEDHGYAVVRYRNGGVGMIEASTATVGINQSRIEISGTLGSLAADFKKMLSFNVPGAELPEFAQDSPLFVYLLSDFVNAVETDAPPYISGESASATTELIMEIYEKSGPPLFHHH